MQEERIKSKDSTMYGLFHAYASCCWLLLLLVVPRCGWFGQLIAIQSRANPWLIYTSVYMPILAKVVSLAGTDRRQNLGHMQQTFGMRNPVGGCLACHVSSTLRRSWPVFAL